MRKTLKNIKLRKYRTIYGIDPSTQSIAVCVLVDGKIKRLIDVQLPKGDLATRLKKVREWFAPVVKLYPPDYVMVESPIFIQNPQTTKNIAYVVGILFGECLHLNIEITDIPPTTWKSWLGYKRVTKYQQAEILSRLGPTAGRKEIERLRKSQVQDIMRAKYPALDWSNDNLADATGIALYANNLLNSK